MISSLECFSSIEPLHTVWLSGWTKSNPAVLFRENCFYAATLLGDLGFVLRLDVSQHKEMRIRSAGRPLKDIHQILWGRWNKLLTFHEILEWMPTHMPTQTKCIKGFCSVSPRIM